MKGILLAAVVVGVVATGMLRFAEAQTPSDRAAHIVGTWKGDIESSRGYYSEVTLIITETLTGQFEGQFEEDPGRKWTTPIEVKQNGKVLQMVIHRAKRDFSLKGQQMTATYSGEFGGYPRTYTVTLKKSDDAEAQTPSDRAAHIVGTWKGDIELRGSDYLQYLEVTLIITETLTGRLMGRFEVSSGEKWKTPIEVKKDGKVLQMAIHRAKRDFSLKGQRMTATYQGEFGGYPRTYTVTLKKSDT